MTKKKIQEIRELPITELEDKVISMKGDLAKEKAQISSGTRAENPGKIKKIRRDIARTLTIINEKKLAGKEKPEETKQPLNLLEKDLSKRKVEQKTKDEKKDKISIKKKLLKKDSSKKKKTKKRTRKKKNKAKKKSIKKKGRTISKKKQKKILRKVLSKKKKGKKGGNEKK